MTISLAKGAYIYEQNLRVCLQSSHLRCSAHWQRHALEPDVRCRRRARQRGARATCGLARRPLAARSSISLATKRAASAPA